MGNENFRDDLNRVFDHVSGSPSPALSDRVRSAVANAPEARGPYWIAGVAAGVMAALIVGVLFVANPLHRPAAPVGGGLPSPSASPSAPPSTSPTPTSQLPAFACTAQHFAATQTPPVVYVDAIRTGTHGTYDRVTIEFANGVPGDVQINAPGGTTFTLSPSGQTVSLQGDHGIVITIHGADLHTSYNGSIDIVTEYGTLVEVRRIQDFEGVVQLALGVKGTGCYRAFFTTNPDRLVIDVQAES